MTLTTTRRERLRGLLDSDQCFCPASVFDPLSVRMAADLGFESAMLAGSIASLAVLGAPDIIVVTLTELAAQVARITRAGDLPLLVDADHGFGNAHNVMRTVAELESAGAAALSIEDTLLPRRYGSDSRAELISIEEAAGKMRAAVAARHDPALVIAGRTHLRLTDVEDACRRVRAYADAGVDAIFLVGVSSRDQLELLAEAVDLPLILGGTGAGSGLDDRDYLAAHGVRLALQGHAPFMAAVQATYNILRALREGTTPGELNNLATADLMRQLTRADEYQRANQEVLGQS